MDDNIFFHDCKAAQEDRCNDELDFPTENGTGALSPHVQHAGGALKAFHQYLDACRTNKAGIRSAKLHDGEQLQHHPRLTRATSRIPPSGTPSFTLASWRDRTASLRQIILNGRKFPEQQHLGTVERPERQRKHQPTCHVQRLRRNMVWDIHSTAGIDGNHHGAFHHPCICEHLPVLELHICPNGTPVMKEPESVKLELLEFTDRSFAATENGIMARSCTTWNTDTNARAMIPLATVSTCTTTVCSSVAASRCPASLNLAETGQVYTGTMHCINANGNSNYMLDCITNLVGLTDKDCACCRK